MSNILYLSVHEILEKDEISLFTEMGYNVFSMGAYQMSSKGGRMRGGIPNLYDNQHLRDVSIQCSKENLHPVLIEWADVILIMHRGDWIKDNWEKMKHKKVVLRTIGQNSDINEREIASYRAAGLKIVRMSPSEATIPDYQGSDALIRFYKDPDEYQGYSGTIPRIVNLSQAMFGSDTVHSRGDHMNLEVFKQVVSPFEWRIFGPDNENAKEHNGGMLSHEDLKQMLRFSRVYFYTGTQPSPYSLGFIEAMMTGIPIVAIGKKLGTTVYPHQQTWDMEEIIQNNLNGYVSNDVGELQNYIKALLEDQELAKRIGYSGRETAIQLFGKQTAKKVWEDFLKTL